MPGKKQIFRQSDNEGKYRKDIVGLETEEVNGESLLKKVVESGRVTYDMPPLKEIRQVTLKNLSDLPDKYKRLDSAPRYPVELSIELEKIKNQLTSHLRGLGKS